MSAEEPTASADVRFTVDDATTEAFYCRRTFAEAVIVANRIGCSLIIQSRYGDGNLRTPEGVIARYRRAGELWCVEWPQRLKPPGFG
jgi:hypothetical protein